MAHVSLIRQNKIQNPIRFRFSCRSHRVTPLPIIERISVNITFSFIKSSFHVRSLQTYTQNDQKKIPDHLITHIVYFFDHFSSIRSKNRSKMAFSAFILIFKIQMKILSKILVYVRKLKLCIDNGTYILDQLEQNLEFYQIQFFLQKPSSYPTPHF